MRRLLFLIALLVSACGTSATISDLEDDKVIVQSNGYDMSVVDAEAARGCALHGKTAVRISYTCADGYCIRKNYLYACKAAE